MGVIPNLRTLMMEEEDEEESNARAFNIDETNVSHQRWKYLLVKLINAISDKSRPIAYLFDDCTIAKQCPIFIKDFSVSWQVFS